jgi:large conductance mechanosensitive channel
MLQEFKAFIAKGNVIELAVGLIMATYFGAIVKSMVDDVIMPPIGMLLGGVDFSDFQIVLQEADQAAGQAAVALKYGSFINNVITFVIVAFAVFLVVRSYNKMKERFEKKQAEAPAAPPAPSKEEQLLTEIRDLLKK